MALVFTLVNHSARALEAQTLFTFPPGVHPQAGLISGPDGNLYGTTGQSASGGGGTIIFRIVLTQRFKGITRSANGNVSVTGTGSAASPYRLWASCIPSMPVELGLS